MKTVFAPGCDLKKSKVDLVKSFKKYLVKHHDCSNENIGCCNVKSILDNGVRVVTSCPGCHETYINNNTSITLYEIIDNDSEYEFVNYQGQVFSIHDSCVFKNEKMNNQFEVIRSLVKKMNIELLEPKKTKNNTECCGEIYIDKLSDEEVLKKIEDRANQMPTDNVIVYCMGCYDNMKKVGKRPVHIMELLDNKGLI